MGCRFHMAFTLVTRPQLMNRLCQDPDLNWGHGDFQSPALPTELSRLLACVISQDYWILEHSVSKNLCEFAFFLLNGVAIKNKVERMSIWSFRDCAFFKCV